MIKILGIDCASDFKNTGFSIGVYQDSKIRVLKSLICDENNFNEIIIEWFNPNETNLIAIDAPLGWPQDLIVNLKDHYAGQYIDVEANQMFRRETDRFVKQTTNKQPLDVGADKIARTALAGIKLINKISSIVGRSVSLAWDPKKLLQLSAVEVYPAVTLFQYNIKSQGYKKPEHKSERTEMMNKIEILVDLPEDKELIVSNANVLDSVVCLISAFDFIKGDVHFPNNLRLARKEGWIWFKKTKSRMDHFTRRPKLVPVGKSYSVIDALESRLLKKSLPILEEQYNNGDSENAN